MKAINRLFIANRGEIALRIIRTCQRLGIETVLGVSEADADSVPARTADQIVLLGPPQAAMSYLDTNRVVRAAVQARADALHPGYGFLSENALLAKSVRESGLIFVGPTVVQLQALGDKLSARHEAETAGLPTVPGGAITDLDSAHTLAKTIGYPVLLKATGGGGGRGMQVFHTREALSQDALSRAMSEADKAFGDARVYLEAYVSDGRHVEVQILGDGTQCIHLGTRDCSVQRRYQKLIEEAPAPDLTDSLRTDLQDSAVRFASHLGYQGAGTVEFLVDRARSTFYFLEMNARIQVEHPVTEAITGIDLIAQQIRLAEGRPLGLRQSDIHFSGHALECRLNAENIDADFQPDPGTVTCFQPAALPGLRVDSHLESGSVISPFYDSLMAKFISHGRSRELAQDCMLDALSLTRVEGVHTNLDLHRRVLGTPAFRSGGVSTAFLPTVLQGGESG